MGVDLTLMPLLSKDFWAAHDVLRLERRRELWDAVTDLPAKPVPQKVSCYMARLPSGETGYGDLEQDPYGGALQYVTAADLLTLKYREEVQDNWMNRAVWSYLTKMPPDWPIVLYWH